METDWLVVLFRILGIWMIFWGLAILFWIVWIKPRNRKKKKKLSHNKQWF